MAAARGWRWQKNSNPMCGRRQMPSTMYTKAEGICRLPHIGFEFFCQRQPLAAAIPAEEIKNRARRVLHHQIRAPILQLAEIIHRQNIWMLKISNTPRLVEEAPQRFLIELIEAQHLQR